MKDFEQRENETYIEYIHRITALKKQNAITYEEWGNLISKGLAEYSPENFRKNFYFIEKILPLLENQNNLDKEKQKKWNDLNSKERQVSMEKEKMKDQKREYFNLIRLEARWQELYDTILKKIENYDNSKYMLDITPYKLKDEKTEAVLMLSDFHIGNQVDTPANKFNIDIAWERIDRLIVKTIKLCNANSVDVLHIALLGDMLNGILRVSNRLENNENVVEQILIVVDMLTYIVSALSQSIRHIELYYAVGNHGRISKLDESIDAENFEYLIWEMVKIKLEVIRLKEKLCYNVHINENEFKEIGIATIFNKRIGLVHGHRDKKQNQALDKLNHLLTDYRVDELLMAHFHNTRVGDGVIVNGSLIGADTYSQGRRLNNEPSQTLVVYHRDKSRVICEINLR